MQKSTTLEKKQQTKSLLLLQVQSFTARIKQLTKHLQQNPKDYSSQRGLYKILAKRKRLLKYINKIPTELAE
jgi:small subunit ribosomal protein S15